MTKIAVLRRLPQPVLDQLAGMGEVLVPLTDAPLDQAGMRELMCDADAVLLAAVDPVDAETIAACPKLKLICNIGVGYDNIDIAAARSRGITVTNTPGAMDDAVADLVFGMLIGVARRLPQADAFVRAGKWTPDNLTGFGLGMDVNRKTLGIIGFGRIGRVIARRATGFEMPVLYVDSKSAAPELEAELRAKRTDLDRLLAESDFVVVQVPYGPSTHHMVGAPQIARMKPTAVLIHAGRGGVVDDQALAAALKSGKIAAAAVDCFEGEPKLHPALLDCPNVLLTPHIGSATPDTRMSMMRMALANLVAA
ncbi:MAG: Glyoxylate/hydroxypyruvate reductase, partial [Pseudomonadota bacterium]